MKRSEALERARRACGKNVAYKLGQGGLHPSMALPCNNQNECDCSGFVCWALGFSRWRSGPASNALPHDSPIWRFPHEWVSTSSIAADAHGAGILFRRVLSPEPGDLIVYPDAGKAQGHVGIVGAVFEGDASSVIHCSSGNWKNTGDAIAETVVAPFWKKNAAIFARPQHYTPEDAVGAADEGQQGEPV